MLVSTDYKVSGRKPDRSIQVRERSGRSEALERLLLGALIALVGVIVYTGLQERMSAWIVRNNAVSFAECLRSMEAYARQSNGFVDFEIVPATPRRRCACFVRAAEKVILKREFPEGVFVSGAVKFDPQGVPVQATRILFVCGKMHDVVQVDEKGVVSIP